MKRTSKYLDFFRLSLLLGLSHWRSCRGRFLIVATVFGLVHAGSALAHGIAGNRYFPGTLTFDDPAVADEFAINSSYSKTPSAGVTRTDNDLTVSGARLLSPTWAMGFDFGKSRTVAGSLARSNQRSNSLFLKTELYRDDLNEELISGSLGYGFTRSDSPAIGTNSYYSVLPGLTIGKGFGNLPESLAWLRPLAIAGALSADLPTQKSSGILAGTQDFAANQSQNVATLHWGFALEYSPLYRTSRFTPGKLPSEEPLHQFVPLIEFAFDSPKGQKTSGTMNPGISYVEQTWQLAAEAIIPVTGNSHGVVGFRVQLLLFLDDLVPAFFERPLLRH